MLLTEGLMPLLTLWGKIGSQNMQNNYNNTHIKPPKMENCSGNHLGVVKAKNYRMILTKPKKSRENHLKMVWDDIFFYVKWKRMGTYLQVLWRRGLRSKTISLIGDLVWKAGRSSSRTNANYCTSVRIISWAMKERNWLARQKLQKKNYIFYWREHQLPNSYCCEG